MTKLFEQANPNIKVNNTLVAYEALHDKIVAAAPAGTYDVVLGDCIWPAEFGSKGIVKDISSDVNSLPTSQIFPGALVMADYKSKYYGMPWILDTKYMYANGSMLKKAGVVAGLAEDLGRRRGRAQADQGQGAGQVPVAGELVPGRGRGLRLRAAARGVRRQVPGRSGKPAFQSGGGLQALEFMKMLLDQGLADPASTSSLEEDVLKAFAQGKIAMNLNWTFQLAASLDPKQSQVAKDDVMILHTPAGIGGRPGAGLQRRPAGDDHQRHQASQRGLGVRQVHHQPVGAEPVRRRLAADLVGLLRRPRRWSRRPASSWCRWPRPSCPT